MSSQTYSISAYYIGKALPLAEIEKKNELALLTKRRNMLVFQPAADQILVVFAFGVAVMFNFDEKTRNKFLKQIGKYAVEPLQKPKTEEYGVVIDSDQKPTVGFDNVVLNKIEPDQIYLVAEVVAQSVAIDYVEERVDDIVSRFEAILGSLEKKGKVPISDKEVKMLIGAGRNIIQYVLAKLSLLDKPDVTWENKDQEALYTNMRQMFELEDRFEHLQFRLEFIQNTSELILDTLQHKQAARLEMTVIILIVFEILMGLYEMFWK